MEIPIELKMCHSLLFSAVQLLMLSMYNITHFILQSPIPLIVFYYHVIWSFHLCSLSLVLSLFKKFVEYITYDYSFYRLVSPIACKTIKLIKIETKAKCPINSIHCKSFPSIHNIIIWERHESEKWLNHILA
jgi:hypothetical protein